MLSVSNISVQFGSKKLFEDVSFIVNIKDRIGLVGSNGTGKTTLLKIISNRQEPDSGIVAMSKHFTVDYLPQDGITFTGKSLYEEVYSGLTDISQVKNEMEEITEELEQSDDKESAEYLELIEKFGELQQRFQDMDGFLVKSKIEKILEGLGFKKEEFENRTDEFSGGWQMRIAMAKLLLKNPSLLLLDEPTNHLDIDSLLWLESYLKSYKGSVIIVSHDRKFLDNVTNKTIEIYTGKVKIYKGNYSFYIREKEIDNELLEKRYINQQKYLKEQERFITRFRYKSTKASAVQSRIKQLDKLERIELEDHEDVINFRFPPAASSGKRIIELKDIKKSYGDKLVLDGVELEIMRGDKIGFVGPNGTGKSTLAKIITGKENYQQGDLIWGHNVIMDYYSQHQADSLNPQKNVLQTLEDIAGDDIRKQLRTLLGGFLFKNDDIEKSVSVLSGGEKSRLALARMLLKPSNFLILDEPTNHLDINSKGVLTEALRRYEGSLMVISHDREFLDGIVNRIIEIKDKKISQYPGTLSEYIRKKEEQQNGYEPVQEEKKTVQLKSTVKEKERKRKEAEFRNKLYKEQKPLKDKLKKTEDNIKYHEELIKEIENKMYDESFYKIPDNIKSANKKISESKAILEKLYYEWMDINEKLNSIERDIQNADR